MVENATCVQYYRLNTSSKIMFNKPNYFFTKIEKKYYKFRYIFNAWNFMDIFFQVFALKLRDEKYHRKCHSRFLKKTQYFKNCKKAEVYCPIVPFFVQFHYILVNSAITLFQQQTWDIGSTFLSFRFLYKVLFYYLVWTVCFDLFYVVCIVFVGVNRKTFGFQSIDSQFEFERI